MKRSRSSSSPANASADHQSAPSSAVPTKVSKANEAPSQRMEGTENAESVSLAKGAADTLRLGLAIDFLPIGILSTIFGLCPLRPRLRVVSLVCKRWRTAVLRSITSLTRGGQGGRNDAPRLLPLLPCLTHLDVPTADSGGFSSFWGSKQSTKPPESLTLPSSLVSLTIYTKEYQFASPLPALTHLEVHGQAVGLAEELMRASQSSLRSFSVGTFFYSCSGQTSPLAFLSSLCFPSLTRIKFDCQYTTSEPDHSMDDEIFALISAHAEQLTSLEFALLSDQLWPRIAKLSFPRLVRLELGFLDSKIALAILNSTPSTTLWKYSTESLASFPAERLTYLVEYRNLVVANYKPDFFSKLSRLERFTLNLLKGPPKVPIVDSPAVLRPRLAALEMSDKNKPAEVTMALQLFTNVETVTLQDILPSSLPESLRLPRLRELRLITRSKPKCAARDVLSFLSTVICISHVNALEAALAKGVSEKDVRELAREADRRGVGELSLSVEEKQLGALASEFHWLQLVIR